MRTIRIATVVGARPQFIKAAAVSRAIAEYNQQSRGCVIEESIIHTGQHYDDNMSKVFFDELHIPRPTVNLNVGSGSHGKQTGAMLEKLETFFHDAKPDWVLIYGDTNSTLAAALAAAKLHIPIAHVEAGLRSFNRRMPEEINRVVADQLSALLFCPTDTAVKNLADEGITRNVYQVGDVMYDSVLFNKGLAEQKSKVLENFNLSSKQYILATVHRAENTDVPERMNQILAAFDAIDQTVVWPIHPRTRNLLGDQLKKLSGHVQVVDPIPYLDMLMLERHARLILTDSGGVQKEAYWFDVPCVTLRDETEWGELVEEGCNVLCGAKQARILDAMKVTCQFDAVRPDLYGSGNSSERIVSILAKGELL